MAVVSSTANALRDEIDHQCSDIIGTSYDDLDDAMKDGMFQAVANAVYAWLTGGTVQGGSDTYGGFKVVAVAGDFGGTTLNGDSPDTVTIDGGAMTEA